MDTALITSLFSAIFIFLLGLYLKNYLPKYMDEKGKNLATKEDIGEITTIIEGIKSQLSRDTEILKADLSLKNQNFLNIKAEERKALIDFHSSYSIWLYTMLNLHFSEYDTTNYLEINNIIKSLDEKKLNFDLADSFLTLFIDNDDFKSLKLAISMGAIDLKQINSMYGVKFMSLIQIHKINMENTQLENQKEVYEKFYAERLKLVTEHGKEIKETFSKLQPKWSEMRIVVKKGIEKVME